MVWLSPRDVKFGGLALDQVSSVVVDWEAMEALIEHGESGPHVAFVDVPRQRVSVKIERSVGQNEMVGVRPSDSAVLSFLTSATSSDASVRRILMVLVITGVRHTVSVKRGVVQVIEGVAVSSDGSADPVVDEALGD